MKSINWTGNLLGSEMAFSIGKNTGGFLTSLKFGYYTTTHNLWLLHVKLGPFKLEFIVSQRILPEA